MKPEPTDDELRARMAALEKLRFEFNAIRPNLRYARQIEEMHPHLRIAALGFAWHAFQEAKGWKRFTPTGRGEGD